MSPAANVPAWHQYQSGDGSFILTATDFSRIIFNSNGVATSTPYSSTTDRSYPSGTYPDSASIILRRNGYTTLSRRTAYEQSSTDLRISWQAYPNGRMWEGTVLPLAPQPPLVSNYPTPAPGNANGHQFWGISQITSANPSSSQQPGNTARDTCRSDDGEISEGTSDDGYDPYYQYGLRRDSS